MMMLLGLFGLLFVAHVTEAGTWLSFNQKTGGMNQPMLHYVPYSQSDIQNPPPAIEPAALPTPPYTFGDTNLLHLLELCNEGSVRARFRRSAGSIILGQRGDLKARSQEFVERMCKKLLQVVDEK
ncbi:hypothetical protein DdX_13850 [Ditylenchus destructor]|uniref:Uncharacterized protein n=1 Tax=Ditylenchus destructor TaxID=166010 RepID=A0AAD4MVQ8_9BILA|nr:hypothetical protein DdX_13850 [Ditylenchus destructor]